MRLTREQCAPQERGSFRAGCQACCRRVGADRAAQGGALQGAAGEPHLRRCRESIPRGRRQLSFTFTYSSDWWRLKWLVFFLTILGWGRGFGIATRCGRLRQASSLRRRPDTLFASCLPYTHMPTRAHTYYLLSAHRTCAQLKPPRSDPKSRTCGAASRKSILSSVPCTITSSVSV